MHILYWRYVIKKPWNEEWRRYESERTVVEVELYNPLTQEIAFKSWHHSLPLAEQSIRGYYPGVRYRRVNGLSPNQKQSWSGIDC